MATLLPPYALDPNHFDHDATRLGLVRERETLNWPAIHLVPGRPLAPSKPQTEPKSRHDQRGRRHIAHRIA